VKKNTVRLYDKLNVHGRHEAVAKARALGYLAD
jgi:ATP/maltotriose-dependent transcriptional regulator MalT